MPLRYYTLYKAVISTRSTRIMTVVANTTPLPPTTTKQWISPYCHCNKTPWSDIVVLPNNSITAQTIHRHGHNPPARLGNLHARCQCFCFAFFYFCKLYFFPWLTHIVLSLWYITNYSVLIKETSLSPSGLHIETQTNRCPTDFLPHLHRSPYLDCWKHPALKRQAVPHRMTQTRSRYTSPQGIVVTESPLRDWPCIATLIRKTNSILRNNNLCRHVRPPLVKSSTASLGVGRHWKIHLEKTPCPPWNHEPRTR